MRIQKSYNFRKIFSSAFFITVLLLLAAGAASSQDLSENGNRLTPVTLGKVRLKAEVVETPEKTYLGLGYRQSLPPDRGMLFIFTEESYQQFCMRGMQFAIDILWIGRGQVVGMEENVQPGEQRPLESPEPVRYVLEVNGGFARRQGIKVGDPVQIGKE
jgi:hypothetical protein